MVHSLSLYNKAMKPQLIIAAVLFCFFSAICRLLPLIMCSSFDSTLLSFVFFLCLFTIPAVTPREATDVYYYHNMIYLADVKKQTASSR